MTLASTVLGNLARAVRVTAGLEGLAREYRTGKITDRAFVKRARALVEAPALPAARR